MQSLIQKIYTGTYNTHLLVGVVMLFGMYSFFIVSTVVAVNERKDIRTEMRMVQAHVADLETSYFNVASHIDNEKASALGFVNAAVPDFAYTQVPEEKVALIR